MRDSTLQPFWLAYPEFVSKKASNMRSTEEPLVLGRNSSRINRVSGKRLSDIQSVRMKIAAMARQVESLQTWLEFVTYQMCTMEHQEANQKIGTQILDASIDMEQVTSFAC